MTSLQTALAGIASRLDGLGLAWALVGGLAVSARAEPRFTRDVDIAVAVGSDHEAETLVRWLLAEGYELIESVEQEATQRFATARLLPPGGHESAVVVDLLFASSGIEEEVAVSSQRIALFGDLEVPVAGVSELLVLKLLSRDDVARPQDAQDIAALVSRIDGETDWDRAGHLAELVTRRGFDRDRDLGAALQAVRSGRASAS